MRVLENCEPKRVFYYFEEICKIPMGPVIQRKSAIILCSLQRIIIWIMCRMR